MSLLDGKQPTLFDYDIDTGTKPAEGVLFHRFKYFFPLTIACEHCNNQKICLFYYCVYHNSLQNFILRKTDFIGFFKIKPRHPDGLKKTDLGGKKHQWEPCAQCGSHSARGGTSSRCLPSAHSPDLKKKYANSDQLTVKMITITEQLHLFTMNGQMFVKFVILDP